MRRKLTLALNLVGALSVSAAHASAIVGGLPPISDAMLSNAYSGVGACATHQFAVTLARNAAPTCAQPAFSDLSGSIDPSQIPNPSASTLGGVESLAAVSHNFLTSISTLGVPTQAQPAFSDLSGSATCAQLPALTGNVTTSAGSCATTIGAAQVANTMLVNSGVTLNAHSLSLGGSLTLAFSDFAGTVAATQLPNPSASTLGGIESLAAVTHNFLTSISTSGVPAQAQPAFTDISGTATDAQIPTTLSGHTLAGTTSVTGNINLSSGIDLQWNADTAFSRLSAGTVALGNGPDGDGSGTLKLAVLTSKAGTNLQINSGNGTVVFGNSMTGVDIRAGAANFLGFSSRGGLLAASDGVLTFVNNAQTSFTRLNFGAATSSFPALKVSGAGLAVRVADDSGDGALSALSFTASGTAGVTCATGSPTSSFASVGGIVTHC